MIMAMAGSAVGLGNMWRFPFLAAQNGGGAFIFVYLILLFLICLPVLMTEMMLGRRSRSNATRVYDRLGAPKWRPVGLFTLITPIMILGFYNVVGGWSVKYLAESLMFHFQSPDADYSAAFSGFISSTWAPVIYTLVFLGITSAVILGGVQKGIERFSKPMMTLLILMIIVIAIRAVTLPGAGAGVRYLLVPDFHRITGKVMVTALGQAFMSMSIGIGILLTYGSYVKSDEDIVQTSVYTGVIDTVFAVIAGLAIIPAVFAIAQMNGAEPAVNAGPGLVFITLPSVFASMPGGQVIAILFFVALLLAAVTSAMSLMEVLVSYFIEEWKVSRKGAVVVSIAICTVLGVLCSLSQGVLADVKIAGMNIFDFFDVVSSDFFITVGAFFMVVFAGWKFRKDDFMDELSCHGTSDVPAWMLNVVYFLLKWIAPLGILIIMASNFILK